MAMCSISEFIIRYLNSGFCKMSGSPETSPSERSFEDTRRPIHFLHAQVKVEVEEDSQDDGDGDDGQVGTAAASSPCLICLDLILRPDDEELVLLPRFQGDHFGDVIMEKDLLSFFILRRILQFPLDECKKVLVSTFGMSPRDWYSVCGSCFQLVEKGVQVHQQIVELEGSLKRLQDLLKGKLEQSFSIEGPTVAENDGTAENILSVHQIIRNYFRRLRSEAATDPKDITIPPKKPPQRGRRRQHKRRKAVKVHEEFSDSDSLASDHGALRSDTSRTSSRRDGKRITNDLNDDDPEFVVGPSCASESVVRRTSPRKKVKQSEDTSRTLLDESVRISSDDDPIVEDFPPEDNTPGSSWKQTNNSKDDPDYEICSEDESDANPPDPEDLNHIGETKKKISKTSGSPGRNRGRPKKTPCSPVKVGHGFIFGLKRRRTVKRKLEGSNVNQLQKKLALEFGENLKNAAGKIKGCGVSPRRKQYTVDNIKHLKNTYQMKLSDEQKIELKKAFQCQICDNQSASQQAYEWHQRKHQVSKYNCRFCKKPLSNANSLRSHMRNTHHVPKYQPRVESEFKCEKCDFTTRVDTSFKVHQRNHNIMENSEELTDNRFRCNLCHQEGPSSNLFYHMKTNHAEETGFDLTMCHLCDSTFTQSGSLNEHIKRVHEKKPYLCPTCGAEFSSKSQYDYHLEEHQNGEKMKRICESCGLIFSSIDTLRNHIRHFHSSQASLSRGRNHPKESRVAERNRESKYKCKFCGISAIHDKALKLHLKTVHSELFKYKCDLCDAMYMKSPSLKIHKDTKHLKKTLVCQYCNKVINSAGYLVDHTKKFCHKNPNSLRYKGIPGDSRTACTSDGV